MRLRIPLALVAIAAGNVTPAVVQADLRAPTGGKPPHGSPLAKVDSALRELRAAAAQGRDLKRSAALRGLRLGRRGRVLVDVYVNGELGAAASALRIEGMDVDATSNDPLKIVEGRLPVAAVDDVAALDWVKAVVAPMPGGTDTGGTLSEGDASHRGPQARALGPIGAGITVGIISDSIDQQGGGVSDSQSSGDLPANVTVLKDEFGGTDEGRAMAEIIYDGAPGIPRIVFASGTGDGLTDIGPVGKADSINQLVASGARVIADDIFYLDEPFFQDGTVTQAVDAARAAGVSYFASAGNRARQSWEGTYTSNGGTTGTDEFHNFGGGDEIQRLATVPNGSRLTIFFQWDEAFGGATTDLDIFLLQDDGSPIFLPGASSSEDDNLASGIPAESISWLNITGFAQPVGLAILRFAGSRSPFMKYIGRSPMPAEHITNSDAINPGAASARGALAVAAIEHNEPGLNDPESFSSRGPKTRLFDSAGTRLAAPEVRQKPTIAGADGVSTSLPPGGLNPFFGTSAATPSAAAIGALILSAKPTNIADDVYAILQEPINSIDCTLAGRPDLDCGMGFVLADNSVARALDPTGPVITPALNPAAPNGKNGFYVTDVTVGFAVSEDGSPITSQTGCEPVLVNTDTPGATFTCTARSTGGTTTTPVTVKRDTAGPALSRLRARKRGTRFGFTLTEAATVTITVERRRRGRFRRERRCKRSGKAGKNAVKCGRPKKAKAGRYRVKMKATDPAGNKSGTKRKRFRVKKRRRR